MPNDTINPNEAGQPETQTAGETASAVLRSFPYQNESIRTVVIDSVPWFVAKDVCDALDLADATTALRGLDDDEKRKTSVWTAGGFQELSVIDESGLYAVVFISRKEQARVFRKWITREVLPSLRRGAYGETQDTSRDPAYVRLPCPGKFQVTLTMEGHLSVVPDDHVVKDYYRMELEALAHASCLVGRVWKRFELLDDMSIGTDHRSNTRYQLSEAIKQVEHIAMSAIRTKLETIDILEATGA